MIGVQFTIFDKETKYIILAECDEVKEYYLIHGLKFTFYNDDDDVVRVKYNKELFEQIEDEAVNQILEKHYDTYEETKRQLPVKSSREW